MAAEPCALGSRQDCLGVQKANMLEKQVDEYRKQARETHREIFLRLNELEQTDSARNQQYRDIIKKLDKLIAWQEEQQQKPARKWEVLVEKIFLLIITAVASFILGRIGL